MRSSNSAGLRLLLLPPASEAVARPFFLVAAVAAVAAEAVATGWPGANGSEAGFRHLVSRVAIQ